MYKRAGLSDKQVLEKIKKKFGSKEISSIENNLKKERNEKFSLEKKKIIFVTLTGLTVLLILLVFFHFFCLLKSLLIGIVRLIFLLVWALLLCEDILLRE